MMYGQSNIYTVSVPHFNFILKYIVSVCFILISSVVFRMSRWLIQIYSRFPKTTRNEVDLILVWFKPFSADSNSADLNHSLLI
jgi:hypothetical protein